MKHVHFAILLTFHQFKNWNNHSYFVPPRLDSMQSSLLRTCAKWRFATSRNWTHVFNIFYRDKPSYYALHLENLKSTHVCKNALVLKYNSGFVVPVGCATCSKTCKGAPKPAPKSTHAHSLTHSRHTVKYWLLTFLHKYPDTNQIGRNFCF